MTCVVADGATRSWAFASCLYALWFIRDILLVILYVLNDVLRRFRCRHCFSVLFFFLAFSP